MRRSVFRQDILEIIPKKMVKTQTGFKCRFHKPNKNHKPKIYKEHEDKETLINKIEQEYKYNGEFK